MSTPFQHPSIVWTANNLEEEWKKFKQHADLVFQGPLVKANEAEKCAYLLIWVGEKGRQIFNSWNLQNGDEKKFDILSTKFKEHTSPRKNTVFARYRFHQRTQQHDENTETFVTDLRTMVKDCGYDKPDEMVRDRIVIGISSAEVREKLLTEGDTLSLDKTVEIAMTYEVTQQHLKSIAMGSATNAVDAIRNGKPTNKMPDDNFINCKNCGNKHKRRSCPAFGKSCLYCKKKNHFAKVCMSKERNPQGIHNIMDDKEETKEDELFVNTISEGEVPNAAFVNVETDTGNTIRFKVDSGAQANVIPLETYNSLKLKPKIRKCSTKLSAYAGGQITVQGYIILKCKHKCQSYTGRFFVVKTPPTAHAQPILGLSACLLLKVLELHVCSVEQTDMTKETVLKEYGPAFKGLGQLEGEIEIHLKDNVQPSVHPPRRVPQSLKAPLKTNLDSMEDSGVIEKVTCPTDWVNSLVVVEKANGKLRICLDPKDLNTAIKRPHYPMPTLEDALSKMAGACYFSKLDAYSGYWQLKLSEASSYLTTFNTPFGRYRFTRLPFGLVSAQDEFQRKMDEVFEGLPGVTPLVDDVIVSGRTKAEHDSNLRAALDRGHQKNLRFNPEKLEVGVQEVSYFGHLLTSEGLKPDPKKVDAIRNMPPPSDKKELKTILGMINFLSKFAPQLSEITKPMRDLLKEDAEFVWDENQQSSLQKAKDVISNKPVLAFFDPEKEVTLETDASKHGLGATLLQEGKPIAFASKSLSQTEQNYAQIEKELYAILFGCQRFHQYIYGRKVDVRSDHKPLESIAKKPLASAPPRLQRMLLQLQKYDIQILHVPGKDIPIADALSRNFPDSALNEEPENPLYQVHSILNNMPISDNKTEEMKNETKNDEHMQKLTKRILEGWPSARNQCDPSIINMWNHRDELSIIDGLIFKGEKILVPPAMRPEMLQKLHTGHLGKEKTKQRARGILFWPGMCAQLDDIVERCPTCNRLRPSQPKEPLMSHSIPTRPWQKVATDIFSWNDRQFLVTVDYYSRFFEIDELSQLTSRAVIRKLKANFARHGIPEEVISDNGPQYAAEEFHNFANEWDFKHSTSSPGYPQSNGLAEKTVQTAKKILEKAKADPNNDPFLALLEYRSTPVDNLASPSELLYSRQLRSILPTCSQTLKPKAIDPETVVSQRQQMQSHQKHYYNQGAHVLPTLQQGQSVHVQLSKLGAWVPAKITAKCEAPRSFVVQTQNGGEYRRNQKFIRTRVASSDSKDPLASSQHTLEATTHTTTVPVLRPTSSAQRPNSSAPRPVSSTCDAKMIQSGRFSSSPDQVTAPSGRAPSAPDLVKAGSGHATAATAPVQTRCGRAVKAPDKLDL
jgi:transposase InsO family protein